jgi:serine/threonine protein kinase
MKEKSNNTETNPIKVFISYSKDSEKHCDLVRSLADQLTKDGISCILDQYLDNGFPGEGWATWLDKNISKADYVLIICTEVYYRGVRGELGVNAGRGVKFEFDLTINEIYKDKSQIHRVIPVLFNENDNQYIPNRLMDLTYYCLDFPREYEALYRRITEQMSKKRPYLKIKGKQKSLNWEDHIELRILKENLSERFEMLGYLGGGGFGKVFRLKDKILERECALKVLSFHEFLPLDEKSREENRMRFKRETRSFAKCEHPNIIPIYDIGGEDDIPYVIMKYIEGKTLKAIISQKGKLEITEVIKISQEVLSGLGYMHQNRLLHRDLKPANIMVEEGTGRVVLLDSYIVRGLNLATSYEDYALFGNHFYISPEQLTDFGKLGPQIDIYSFGVILYEMLTGEVPFEGSPSEVIRKHVAESIPDVRLKNPNLPRGIEKIISKAMAKKPKDRYRNAQEFLDDLKKFELKDIHKKEDSKKFNYNNKARKFVEKGRYDKALSIIQKAEEENCADEYTLSLKAKALELKGEDNKASQLRMELINGNSIYTAFYNDEASFLVRKKHYWDAISIISKAEDRNCADDNTRALKEKVIKNLSDDEEQSFRKPTKDGKSINYPDTGFTLGRDETIGTVIELSDKTPIITVYGIPGIGKSVFIHEIRKSEPHNNRLYKRVIAKPGMTVNDFFQQLALLLGCRDTLNRPEFDLSKQSDFSFLETEAQYRVASLIHLDDAQHLFHKNQFRDNAVKEFLVAVIQYYPDTRIILECRIVPPAGIFPESLHQSISLHGVDKNIILLYFLQPLKNNPGFGWRFGKVEQELVFKNLGGIKAKERVHPLAMVLLARRAHQLNITPVMVLTNLGEFQEFIDESESLIFVDMNQAALESTGQNISRNIEMYREDIPVYLSESLQECIRELEGDSKIEELVGDDTNVDNWENKLRKAVSEKLYSKGKKHLLEIIKLDQERKERLKEEFGYIYDVDNPEVDENQWKQKVGQIEWRRKVWQVLSMRNNFELKEVDSKVDKQEILDDKIDSNDVKNDLKDSKKEADKNNVEIGEELEKAVLKLFKDFFNIWEEDNTLTLTNARQQGKGLQFGHDLKFVCGRLGDKEIRFLIECKNYSEKIATRDIADKLMQVDEYYDKDHIDHWILISPNEDVSNELENFIESWEKKGKFSFKVQAWTPATRVKDFFGLNPDIYDKIIKAPDLEIHPKEWSDEKNKKCSNSGNINWNPLSVSP